MLQRTTEWLNSNRYRRYPFADDADMSGIPNDAVLDFQLTAAFAGAARLTGLQTLAEFEGICFVFEADRSIIRIELPPAAAYPYTVTGMTFYGLTYKVTFGEGCAGLFTAEATARAMSVPLLPALVVVQDRHRLDSVTADDDDYHDTLMGVIEVRPGTNCDPVVVEGEVRIVCGKGLGTGRACNEPEDTVISGVNALANINGQTPDDNGNIVIQMEGALIQASTEHPHELVVSSEAVLDQAKCG